MTDDELRTLRGLLDGQMKMLRRCQRFEAFGVCLTLIGCCACAFSILRSDSTMAVRAITLVSFAINAHVCRNAVREWRSSRRVLRMMAETRKQLELERIARL